MFAQAAKPFTFSECSYKSRQPRGGPAPFASFEDLSDYLGEENALITKKLALTKIHLQPTTHLPRRLSLYQVIKVHLNLNEKLDQNAFIRPTYLVKILVKSKTHISKLNICSGQTV